MKKAGILVAGLMLVSTTAMAQTFCTTQVPAPIPSSGTIGFMEVTIDIDCGGNVLGDVAVDLEGTHTFSGDLDFTITNPGGTFNNPPVDATPGGSAAWAGDSFTLSDFNGENGNGTWTVRIDDRASGDSGTLTAACLTMTCGEPPPTVEELIEALEMKLDLLLLPSGGEVEEMIEALEMKLDMLLPASSDDGGALRARR